jgi:hypothetical protein
MIAMRQKPIAIRTFESKPRDAIEWSAGGTLARCRATGAVRGAQQVSEIVRFE